MDFRHIRICHKHAIAFLTNEIEALQWSLEYDHLLDNDRKMLEKRLKELEADFDEISQYDF